MSPATPRSARSRSRDHLVRAAPLRPRDEQQREHERQRDELHARPDRDDRDAPRPRRPSAPTGSRAPGRAPRTSRGRPGRRAPPTGGRRRRASPARRRRRPRMSANEGRTSRRASQYAGKTAALITRRSAPSRPRTRCRCRRRARRAPAGARAGRRGEEDALAADLERVPARERLRELRVEELVREDRGRRVAPRPPRWYAAATGKIPSRTIQIGKRPCRRRGDLWKRLRAWRRRPSGRLQDRGKKSVHATRIGS